MKKWIAIVATTLVLFGLVGCGASNKKADGVYTAQADDAYVEKFGYGWRDTLTVTYKNGKVVDAVFDSFDESGARKSELTDYNGMEPTPSVWIPQISSNVKVAVDGKVDVVAGATISSGNAAQLLAAIETDGRVGETIHVPLDAPKK